MLYLRSCLFDSSLFYFRFRRENFIGINLSKEESIKKISLRKDKVISLAKERDLSGVKSRVALALDFSGSMSSLFEDGTVQSIIERLIPLALNFDDNGELDF